MRIDLNPKGPESLSESKRTSSNVNNENANAQAANGVSSETGDWAELSSTHVNALAAQVNDLPEVRQDKVEALSAAIRNGSYDVTPQQTAEAMMSQMLGHAA